MAGEQSKKKNIIIIGGTVAGAFASAFLSLLVYWALRKKTKRNIITVVEDGKIKGRRSWIVPLKNCWLFDRAATELLSVNLLF